MKKVITYGSFDLFHEGHLKLIERAKALGDYLIVGITTDHYDEYRGKINIRDSLITRIENIKATGLADEIIIEHYYGQKIEDIIKYNIDIFAIGSDWKNQFDHLEDYCEVVYLERTKGISSTQLRESNDKIIRIGIIGTGRIANRFIPEAKYVSGIHVQGVYNPRISSAKVFGENYDLKFYTDDLNYFLENIDAVYIASPVDSHYEYTKYCLNANKHVLCEKPFVLEKSKAEELFNIANKKNLILMEAIKTAYCMGFNQLINIVKNGKIGQVIDIEACFTKLVSGNIRELDPKQNGGSVTELASYTLLPIIKILGIDFKDISFTTFINEDNVDLYTKINLEYNNQIATSKTGLSVKSDGHLLISGTKGYIFVEAPWWKTQVFEIRYENPEDNEKFFFKFAGDGLRYELSDFISLILNKDCNSKNYKLREKEIIALAEIIELFLNKKNTKTIKLNNDFFKS